MKWTLLMAVAIYIGIWPKNPCREGFELIFFRKHVL